MKRKKRKVVKKRRTWPISYEEAVWGRKRAPNI